MLVPKTAILTKLVAASILTNTGTRIMPRSSLEDEDDDEDESKRLVEKDCRRRATLDVVIPAKPL
jgi:hypothetical protein